MKNTKLILLLFICATIHTTAQKIKYGKYESKRGSSIILNKNNSFEYVKSNAIIYSDIILYDFDYTSFGKYRQERNILFLNSDDLHIKNNEKKEVKLLINETNTENRKKYDSINVKANYDSTLIKLYLCNTGIEINNNADDMSTCLRIYSENRLPDFGNRKYFLRIYPNIDNYRVREQQNIRTLYFDSEMLEKKKGTNLELSLDFKLNNFNLVFFDQEIFLIIDENTIFHEGEELVYVKP